MKIQHLLSDLNEAGPRTAAQQATMKAAASGMPQANNPFNLKVMPGGKGGAATTSPSIKYNVPQTAATGDTTLNKPLPAKAPKDPNAPGFATKLGRGIGQVGKAIGAVAGVPAGFARAVQKGYQAGAGTVGGPGRSTSAAPVSPATSAGSNEVDSLKSMLQAMDARLRKAGI